MAKSATSGQQTALIIGLLIGHLALSLLVSNAGHMSWDSGTYHLMVRALFETGSFEIANGYDDLASPILVVGQTVTPAGRLVGQYPEFYTLLALPFYALFDFAGFRVLNSLAFLGILILIRQMTPWFTPRKGAPLAAMLVYGLCTFAWEYTQSAYPHLTSSFLVLLVCRLAWGVYLGKTRGREPVALALAGLVFGLAVGVRYDSLFAGLALGLPLLTGRGIDWRRALPLAMGALVPLTLLAAINQWKFGTFNPLSYGRAGQTGYEYEGSLEHFYPMIIVVLACLVLYAMRHYLVRGRPSSRQLATGLLVLALALLATRFGQQLLAGLFQILVDMRIRPDIAQPALSRSPDGALIYFSKVKKALLESLPYLVLIVPAAVRGLRRGSYGNTGYLWLAPAGFFLVFGFLAWHGSVGVNQRFLMPALPFLAILAAIEISRFGAEFARHRSAYLIGAPLLWVVLYICFLLSGLSIAAQERLILDGGLALAAMLLLLQTLRYAGSRPVLRSHLVPRVAVASLIWASALAWSEDFTFSNSMRGHLAGGVMAVADRVEDNAVILTYSADLVWGFLDLKADPILGDYGGRSCDEIGQLLDHFSTTRPIYWITPAARDSWQNERDGDFCAPRRTPEGREVTYIEHDQGPGRPRYFRLYDVRVGG